MPTKSKRATLKDIKQGKTVWSLIVYREWDRATNTIKSPMRIIIDRLFLNGKIKREDDSISIGTDSGDQYLCGIDGIVNEKTCSIFTKQKAAFKYAENFKRCYKG